MSDALKKYNRALLEVKKELPDIPLVLDLLNQAIDDGSCEAAYALATWYLYGHHVAKDWNKAVFLLKTATRAKLPSAFYDLAVCYEEGKGIKKNEAEAFRLYLRAAINGDNQSVHEVGRCYYYGIGIEKDEVLAEIWLERAEDLEVD